MNMKNDKSMKKRLDRLFNGPTAASVVEDVITQAFECVDRGLNSILGWHQKEREGKLVQCYNERHFDDGGISGDYFIYLFPDKITINIEFDNAMIDQEITSMRQAAKQAFGHCVEQYDPDVFITCRIFHRAEKINSAYVLRHHVH